MMHAQYPLPVYYSQVVLKVIFIPKKINQLKDLNDTVVFYTFDICIWYHILLARASKSDKIITIAHFCKECSPIEI